MNKVEVIGYSIVAILLLNSIRFFLSLKKIGFLEQYEIFRKLGFELNPNADISDIDRWGSRTKFEEKPFELMYITLGLFLEREPWSPITNRCWYFDTEAIEGEGSYSRIIKNIQRLTHRELNFENVEDYVDMEGEVAWVSFILNGDKYKWDLNVYNDWIDPQFFDNLIELTKKYSTKSKFTYYPEGQSIVIGYETPDKLKEIKKATGLKIEWFKGPLKIGWN